MVRSTRPGKDGVMDLDTLPELRRSRDDAVVAGVCSTLARSLGLDPLLVRVGMVLLALSSGIGLAVYGWCWLVMPRAGEQTSLLEHWYPAAAGWSPQQRRNALLVACLLTALVLLGATPWSIGPALVLGGLFLLARHQRQHDETPATTQQALGQQPPVASTSLPRTTPFTDFERAAMAWRARLDEVQAAAERPNSLADLSTPAPTVIPTVSLPAPTPLPDPQAWPPTAGATALPVRRPRRSWLFGIVLLLAAAGAGTLAAMWAPSSSADLMGEAVALTVVASGLAATWLLRLPRPRLAVVAGLALMVALLVPRAMPEAGTELTGSQQHFAWSSSSEVPEETQRLTASTVTYDLSGLTLDRDVDLALQARVSTVVVLVAKDAPLEIDYALRGATLGVVGAGQDTHVVGGSSDSIELPGSGKATVTLDLQAWGSTVEVRRV